MKRDDAEVLEVDGQEVRLSSCQTSRRASRRAGVAASHRLFARLRLASRRWPSSYRWERDAVGYTSPRDGNGTLAVLSYFAFGEHDVVLICEMPDNVASYRPAPG